MPLPTRRRAEAAIGGNDAVDQMTSRAVAEEVQVIGIGYAHPHDHSAQANKRGDYLFLGWFGILET